MIKLENFEVLGWEHAIRGLRNPMNSWEKSDSYVANCDVMACSECIYHSTSEDGEYVTCHQQVSPFAFNEIPKLGPNDHELMMKLTKGGPVHAKYRRMITVYVDITAPLYWWKEFDTYKVGTVANSCSTMHKIHAYNFDRSDFSHERLMFPSLQVLDNVITELNFLRNVYINGKITKRFIFLQCALRNCKNF